MKRRYEMVKRQMEVAKLVKPTAIPQTIPIKAKAVLAISKG